MPWTEQQILARLGADEGRRVLDKLTLEALTAADLDALQEICAGRRPGGKSKGRPLVPLAVYYRRHRRAVNEVERWIGSIRLENRFNGAQPEQSPDDDEDAEAEAVTATPSSVAGLSSPTDDTSIVDLIANPPLRKLDAIDRASSTTWKRTPGGSPLPSPAPAWSRRLRPFGSD